jgi:hypothetical protein
LEDGHFTILETDQSICVIIVEDLKSQFLAPNMHFGVENSTKNPQNGKSRHPIRRSLKIEKYF